MAKVEVVYIEEDPEIGYPAEVWRSAEDVATFRQLDPRMILTVDIPAGATDEQVLELCKISVNERS